MLELPQIRLGTKSVYVVCVYTYVYVWVTPACSCPHYSVYFLCILYLQVSFAVHMSSVVPRFGYVCQM